MPQQLLCLRPTLSELAVPDQFHARHLVNDELRIPLHSKRSQFPGSRRLQPSNERSVFGLIVGDSRTQIQTPSVQYLAAVRAEYHKPSSAMPGDLPLNLGATIKLHDVLLVSSLAVLTTETEGHTVQDLLLPVLKVGRSWLSLGGEIPILKYDSIPLLVCDVANEEPDELDALQLSQSVR